MPDQNWSGELWSARDLAVLRAAAGDVSTHKHYCHQVMIERRACQAIGASRITAEYIVVESLCPHRIITMPASGFIVFAEPLAFESAALMTAVSQASPTADTVISNIQNVRRQPAIDRRVESTLNRIDTMLAEKFAPPHGPTKPAFP